MKKDNIGLDTARILQALEGTIFSKNGLVKTHESDDLKIYEPHAKRVFYYGDNDFSLRRILRECSYTYSKELTSLSEICDHPWISNLDISWYDPILSHHLFNHKFVGDVTVKYNRKTETFQLELTDSFLGSSNKSGNTFVAKGMKSNKDVLKLLNAAMLWEKLFSEQQSLEEERKRQEILDALP